MVRVEVPLPASEAGEKAPVAPEGSPLAASATLPVKPFRAVTVVV
jgi:hypothetical protein